MILIASVYPNGSHMAGWRHPSAFGNAVMNLDAFIEMAQLAERGKFHSLFIADGNAVRNMDRPKFLESPSPVDRPASFEPGMLMAALSQHTEHIGLFVTATTTYDQPYLVARRLASLDHMSHGRAVWNVVTGSYEGDSVNFGEDQLPDHAARYERSDEFLGVCKGLWDSWDEDAFVQDKGTGRFLDATKVRPLNHVGTQFRVKGPLNVARSPQVYPLLFMAGQSELGREMAAKQVDCMLTISRKQDEAIALYNDVKSRLEKYDRLPDQLKIIPGASVNVFESHTAAVAHYRELNALVTPEVGVGYLSTLLNFDLSRYDLDDELPSQIGEEARGVTSYRALLWARARERGGMTIREAVSYWLNTQDVPPFTGSGAEVADELEEWFRRGACDGFILSAPDVPRGLERIVELLIPELQRRGLFHEEYSGGTLREEIGAEVKIMTTRGAH
jgi:FMN-dependent oxidoreductase (nitrilotriacetate monooxygenase family)